MVSSPEMPMVARVLAEARKHQDILPPLRELLELDS
jgi:hypothetical protein